MQLTIPARLVKQIVTQAQANAPIEACGILGGVDGVASTCYEMENADNSPEHFTLVPQEQFRVVKTMRSVGERMLAIYHSHPATPARPSEEDIRMAFTPGVIYVIVSIAEGEPVVKGFDIQEGKVTEATIEFTNEGDA